jgi:hypothetical protein
MEDVCVICLEILLPGATVDLWACDHVIHDTCFDAWAQKSLSFLTCPCCRAPRPDAGSVEYEKMVLKQWKRDLANHPEYTAEQLKRVEEIIRQTEHIIHSYTVSRKR